MVVLSGRAPPLFSGTRLLRFRIRGRVDAERALEEGTYTHLISLRDTGSEPLVGASRVRDRLELEFDDAENPDSVRLGYRPPQEEDVGILIAWVREREEQLRRGHCLFHCEQGISRSSASACITLQVLGMTREQALASVKRESPGALPNRLMLELASGLLTN